MPAKRPTQKSEPKPEPEPVTKAAAELQARFRAERVKYNRRKAARAKRAAQRRKA
jgi:hypothetical protein